MEMATLTSLLAPGVIGTYTHFEATEVIAIELDSKRVLNVFTLLVAENREAQAAEGPPKYLSPKLIELKSIPSWKFGVVRYLRPIGRLEPALAAMIETGRWSASGDPLHVGELAPPSSQFVPPDNATDVSWNKVLKNNFWNGCHVFEWARADRKSSIPFFNGLRGLQELSARVSELVPIALDALSDRLGAVVVQLPVNVAMCEFSARSDEFAVEIAWAPGAAPRRLRATCHLEFDGIISGYMSGEIDQGQLTLPMGGLGLHRGFVWDEHNRVLIAATGPGAFIDSAELTLATLSREPRAFSVVEQDGITRTSVEVTPLNVTSTVVRAKGAEDTGRQTRQRMSRERMNRLAAERVFVQYKPQPDSRDEEHTKALEDLRILIRRYGRTGAWLWDPFLSGRDLIQTLFHCPHAGSDLRALTAGDEVSSEPAPGHSTRKEAWIRRQQAVLNSVESNWAGLRLEYRIRHGAVGFGFHDRFLIFPQPDDEALAWSLGTSVNGVGMDHHILQRVDNGPLIRDAFLELWDQLDQPEHLVWKRP